VIGKGEGQTVLYAFTSLELSQKPPFLVLLKKQLVLRVGFPLYGFPGNSGEIEGDRNVVAPALYTSFLFPDLLATSVQIYHPTACTGLMFWFIWKRLFGSYLRFSSTRRS
jgi:hypothetical protein